MASTSDTLGSVITYAQIQRELQTGIQLDIDKQTEMQLDGQTDKYTVIVRQVYRNIIKQQGMWLVRHVYSQKCIQLYS